MGVITDHRTLRGMELRGFIIRHGTAKARERHWSGMPVRVCHVAIGPQMPERTAEGTVNWRHEFKYHGKLYRIEYFDGCFHPFVVEVGKPLPPFV